MGTECMTDLGRKNILIVEDEAGPRYSLKMILSPSFTVFTAENSESALQIIHDHRIDLITLDLKLPDRPGIDLLREIRHARHEAEVIVITGYGSLESAIESIQQGIAGFILKPFNVAEVITTVNQSLEKKHHLDYLRNFIKDFGSLWDGNQDVAEISERLAKLLGAKDTELCRHSRQTQLYATMLGRQLDLHRAEHELLETGALLHDIGMIGMDDHIVNTHGSENAKDFEIYRRHSEIGARMAHSLGLHSEISHIIRYHHERYDGSGYPEGLKDDAIPLVARIVGIAQSFDHVITGDINTPAMSARDASIRMQTEAGSRYDPKLVDSLMRMVT